MTTIERYKEAKRHLNKCQEDYAECLQFVLRAKRNRDDAEKDFNAAQYDLAQELGVTTVAEVEKFVNDPFGIDRYVMGIRNSSIVVQEEKKNE